MMSSSMSLVGKNLLDFFKQLASSSSSSLYIVIDIIIYHHPHYYYIIISMISISAFFAVQISPNSTARPKKIHKKTAMTWSICEQECHQDGLGTFQNSRICPTWRRVLKYARKENAWSHLLTGDQLMNLGFPRRFPWNQQKKSTN